MIALPILCSFLYLLFLIVVDSRRDRFSNRTLHRIGFLLHTSQRFHVSAYLSSLFLLTISFNILVRESGSRFLIEAFPLPTQTLIWSIMILLVLLHNFGRFRWTTTETENRQALLRVLEETVEKASNPAAGIDHVIGYVTRHQNRFPPDILEEFLAYLSLRDDTIGKEARKRHEDIQISDS
ncbi:MAG: hypothetical protein DRO93_15975 [Candidatus Thorarchaeota archaeon]|nr:MAG: hypothetical protein DRO93_15975 [Candidatus Thorarchaeota archaeon]